MSVFDKYPKSYYKSLSDEQRQIKTVLDGMIPMNFRYRKTCGLFDLTYTVEDKYIVKFENPKSTRDTLKRLVALAGVLRAEKSILFDLPNMYGSEYETESDNTLYAVWYEKINGRVLDRQNMDIYRGYDMQQRRKMDVFMEQIGTFMAQLHAVPVMEFAHLFPKSVPGQIQQAVWSVLPQLKTADKSFRRQVEEGVLYAVYPGYDEVLCHNDLNLWNIARREDNTIAGIFDLGMANINRPVSEMRYWDYFDEHVDIIARTYNQKRGVALDAPKEECLVGSHKQLPRVIFNVYDKIRRAR